LDLKAVRGSLRNYDEAVFASPDRLVAARSTRLASDEALSPGLFAIPGEPLVGLLGKEPMADCPTSRFTSRSAP